MEDSFRSSPNRVTKTRFRNKILRTLFFLSHLIYRLQGCKKPSSTPPPLDSPPARSSGRRCVRGGGGGGRAGSGDGTPASCEPRCLAPRRRLRGPGPAPRARLSAQAQGAARTPAAELPVARPPFKANTFPEDTSPSFNRSHTPQTSPHAPNSPYSFPNSKQETPPPGVQPSAQRRRGEQSWGAADAFQ